jgi:hypothetical protein
MAFANVTVLNISEFVRTNFHTPKAVDEVFECIEMQTSDGYRLRNFTRQGSEFSRAVKVDESFPLSYTVKEKRTCPETGMAYTAVTFCSKGQTKAAIAVEKKAAKILARNRKLGLA